jgi:hypothetical protein
MTSFSLPQSATKGIATTPLSDNVVEAFAADTKLMYAPGNILFCTVNVPPPNAILTTPFLLVSTFDAYESCDPALTK